MIYRTKAYKRIALSAGENHPKYKDLYRMVVLTADGYWTMTLRGKGINNPWLPKEEARANMREHALRLGWEEEKKCTRIFTESTAQGKYERLLSLAQMAK